jgi:hypothetical protein
VKEVPDGPKVRRDFIPDDPTEDPNFNPANWTGTILSGLISSRSECGDCGAEWTDDHQCGGTAQ